MTAVTARQSPMHGQPLTAREITVCDLLSVGMTSKQIARQMRLSWRTVDDYRQRALKKTGCRNTAQLVGLMLRKKFDMSAGGRE